MLEKNTTPSLFLVKPSASNQEPVLAPPGAGIPLRQKIMMRFFVRPFVAGRTPWEVSEANFRKINEKILKTLEGLNDSQLTTRILIPPQLGLEDSSRYWSIKMVLEHLLIVSGQMMQLIPALSHGVTPNGKADTAAVKPKNEISLSEILKNFNKLISADFDRLNASIQNRDTRNRFYHPWFGDMTAKQWYWLLAIHHGLHLKQIREIKKRLPLI